MHGNMNITFTWKCLSFISRGRTLRWLLIVTFTFDFFVRVEYAESNGFHLVRILDTKRIQCSAKVYMLCLSL